MVTSSSQSAVIERIIALAQADPAVDIVWLYGSRAKGTAGEDSDFDLAVAFNHFPEDCWERRLQPELLALDWAGHIGLDSHQISVADINHIPLTLAFTIINSGRVLLVKDSLRLAREENRITSQWEVDHEYHKTHFG